MTDKVGILKNKYWSKNEAFLLPLTGIRKDDRFEINSYLRWDTYSIDNYNLIVKIEYGHRYLDYLEYLTNVAFKNEGGLLTETYDYEGFSIMLYDISEWAFDVEQFMDGKYSKMSKKAKDVIEDFHLYYVNDNPKIKISIYSCLYPTSKPEVLKGKTPIEYVLDEYDFDEDARQSILKSGELCSIVSLEDETLIIEG